jgi:hypothetical protein
VKKTMGLRERLQQSFNRWKMDFSQLSAAERHRRVLQAARAMFWTARRFEDDCPEALIRKGQMRAAFEQQREHLDDIDATFKRVHNQASRLLDHEQRGLTVRDDGGLTNVEQGLLAIVLDYLRWHWEAWNAWHRKTPITSRQRFNSSSLYLWWESLSHADREVLFSGSGLTTDTQRLAFAVRVVQNVENPLPRRVYNATIAPPARPLTARPQINKLLTSNVA